MFQKTLQMIILLGFCRVKEKFQDMGLYMVGSLWAAIMSLFFMVLYLLVELQRLKRSLGNPETRIECNTTNPPPYELNANKSDFFTFNDCYKTKLQLSNPAHRETSAVHDPHRF